MKKRIFAVIASVIVLVISLPLAAFAAECPHSNKGYEAISARAHQETCYDCGEFFGVYDVHVFGAWSYDDNRHYQTCSVCGYENGGYHEYDSGEYDGDYIVYTCWCGSQVYEHKHSWVHEQYESNFYHRLRCTICGEIQEQTHSYDEGVYNPASGGTLANYTYTCKYCGYVDVRYIYPSHTECDESKFKVKYYNIDSHRYSCSICDKQFKIEPHQWSVVVTKQPTPSENGIRTYTCIICNYIKTETIDYIDLDKLLEDMTQEEAAELYKKIFNKYQLDLVEDKEMLKPYLQYYISVIYADIAKNGAKSIYAEAFMDSYYDIQALQSELTSDYTKGYNDALKTIVDENPIQGLFQGMWSGVVHFISVVGGQVSLFEVSLISVVSTLLIVAVGVLILKLFVSR